MSHGRATQMGFLRVDRRRRSPVYQQVYEGIREAILSGQLSKGTQILSSRELAQQLELSRTTVLTALKQLIAEGYLSTTAATGTFVSSDLPSDRPIRRVAGRTAERPAARRVNTHAKLTEMGQNVLRAYEKLPTLDSETRPFRPCIPALDEFPGEIWSQLWRKVFKGIGPDELSYQDPAGCLRLRESIADYLASHRGVRCEPDQVLITNGTVHSLDLCARLLAEKGEGVYFENPGYPTARAVFESYGLQFVPLSVDGSGARLPRPSNSSAVPRLACLTPSHQFPLGATLSIERRLGFIEWANANDSWIVEDDYDSEYRYAQKPVPSMQGLDESCRTIYMGSFSKVAFPGLGMAYVVVPKSLKQAFAAALAVSSRPASIVDQLTLCEFMRQGHFARHLRRMRKTHKTRRDVFASCIEKLLSDKVEIIGSNAGLHCSAKFIDAGLVSDEVVCRDLESVHLTARPLSRHYLPGSSARERISGLVLGFAHARPGEIRSAVSRLAKLVRRRYA